MLSQAGSATPEIPLVTLVVLILEWPKSPHLGLDLSPSCTTHTPSGPLYSWLFRELRAFPARRVFGFGES